MTYKPTNTNAFIQDGKRYIFKNPKLELVEWSYREDRSGFASRIKFKNAEGISLTSIVNNIDLSGKLSLALKEAIDKGYRLPTGAEQADLKEYLQNYRPEKIVIRLGKVGYHKIGKQYIYATPKKVLGDDEHNYTLDMQDNGYLARFTKRGKLSEWNDSVVKISRDVPQLVFAIGVALAGTVLRYTNVGNAALHLYHEDSSIGKTTALRVASSVLGAVGESPQDAKYMCDWLSTANAMEQTFIEHNDMTAMLDEISLLHHHNDKVKVRKIAADVAHRLDAGNEKARRTQTLGKAKQGSWNCLVLSSGNFSLGSTSSENAGKRTTPAEARFLDIPFVFEDEEALKEFSLPSLTRLSPKLCAKLARACQEQHGSAGRIFLSKVLGLLNSKGKNGLSELLEAHMAEFLKFLRVDTNNNIKIRTSRKFALAYAAAKLALDLKVLRGGLTSELIRDSVAVCYIAYEHTHGEFDSDKAVQKVRDFLVANKDKFVLLTPDNKWNTEKEYKKLKGDGVGFKFKLKDTKYFLIDQKLFRNQLCNGVFMKQMTKSLADRKVLALDNEGRPTKNITWRTKDKKRQAFYWISADILQIL